MIRFSYAGIKYAVGFEHTLVKGNKRTAHSEMERTDTRYTICRIAVVPPVPDGKKERVDWAHTLYKGRVACWYKDRYSKAGGRRAALSKALGAGASSREFRKAAWKAYFETVSDLVPRCPRRWRKDQTVLDSLTKAALQVESMIAERAFQPASVS